MLHLWNRELTRPLSSGRGINNLKFRGIGFVQPSGLLPDGMTHGIARF